MCVFVTENERKLCKLRLCIKIVCLYCYVFVYLIKYIPGKLGDKRKSKAEGVSLPGTSPKNRESD